MQVRKPQKYYLDPDKTLKDIINIYTNLGDVEEFMIAIKKDDRYFKIQNFKAAAQKLRLNSHGVDLRSFSKVIESLSTVGDSEEDRIAQILDDINAPEDFLCPLSGCVMRYPMLLPTSGQICDKDFMKRVLLK